MTFLDGAHAPSFLLIPSAPKVLSPLLIPPAPKPQAPSSFRLRYLGLLASTDLPVPLVTMGTEVLTIGHGPGDYGSQIGQRWVARTCQGMQSADDGSREGDKGSPASNDGLRASDNGSHMLRQQQLHTTSAARKHHCARPKLRMSTSVYDHCYTCLRLHTITTACDYVCA